MTNDSIKKFIVGLLNHPNEKQATASLEEYAGYVFDEGHPEIVQLDEEITALEQLIAYSQRKVTQLQKALDDEDRMIKVPPATATIHASKDLPLAITNTQSSQEDYSDDTQ